MLAVSVVQKSNPEITISNNKESDKYYEGANVTYKAGADTLSGVKETNIEDHHMHIKDQHTFLAQRRNDSRSEADVRHEVPVHYIKVQIVCPRALNPVDLFTEAGKIRGK